MGPASVWGALSGTAGGVRAMIEHMVATFVMYCTVGEINFS